MQIAIHAAGSRGDVQPYVALGKGLKAAGYDVRILSSDDFEILVQDAGLTFLSTGHSIQEQLQSDEWRAATEGGNFLKILGKMQAEMKIEGAALASRMPDLLAGNDLIIAGMAGVLGTFSIAEKFEIPIIQAYPYPFTPTTAFPGPLVPKLPVGGVINKLSFHIMRQMFWQTQKTSDVITRKQLGMARAPFFGPFRQLRERRVPVLYGYSPSVLPEPDDWADYVTVTGYWFLDEAQDWTPPADLVDFLQAGPPPVYIGFGSMGNRNPEEAGRIALEALALSGQRGVVASGWGGLSTSELPDNVIAVGAMPHSWLFPRMAAVVHHGGAGTTAAGLRAGVPSIVVPFMGDQPFWGQRVVDLGVGTAPIARKKLTGERLAGAITQVVTDNPMQQRATALGERIRAENGVDEAAAIIARFASKSV